MSGSFGASSISSGVLSNNGLELWRIDNYSYNSFHYQEKNL